MQVDTNHSAPAYVANAFARLQQEHLWDDVTIDTNDDIRLVLSEIQQEEHVQTNPVIVRKLGNMNVYAAGKTAVKALEQAFEANISPERRERIKAEVKADVDRILGMQVTVVKEADPCVSEVRIVEAGVTCAYITPIFTDGTWEAPKPMVEVGIFRQLPESLKDAVVAKNNYSHEFEQHQTSVSVPRPVPKLVDKSLIEWLGMVDRETPAFAELEMSSRNGRESIEAIRRYLFEGVAYKPTGLREDVADEFESFGYTVSFDRIAGTLLFVMKTGTLRWSVV